jgi:hypothetical protein
MRKFLFLLCLLLSVDVYSQNLLQDPVTGRTFNSEKYSGIKGSPFFFEDWIKGSATVPNGTYRNLELKLDSYNNTVLFKRNDVGIEFAEPVISFILMPNPADSSTYLKFRRGLSGSTVKPDQYVQVIGEGRISVYRSDMKLMADVNQINEGVIRTFTNSTRYYVLKEDHLQPLKLNKKDVFELMNDKEKELELYISQNNLSTKKEQDLARIIQYYNSLN